MLFAAQDSDYWGYGVRRGTKTVIIKGFYTNLLFIGTFLCAIFCYEAAFAGINELVST